MEQYLPYIFVLATSDALSSSAGEYIIIGFVFILVGSLILKGD